MSTTTVRLPPGVLDDLCSAMSRAELARQIGINKQTLTRYVTGKSTPSSPPVVSRLLELLACGPKDLFVLGEGQALNEHHPCPSWCESHELVMAPGRGAAPGCAEVLINWHQSQKTRLGQLSIGLTGYIDRDPQVTRGPRVFIDAKSDYGCIEKKLSVSACGLSVEEVRWVAAQMVRLTELVEQEAAK